MDTRAYVSGGENRITAMEDQSENRPVIPLPNPGEGGPVADLYPTVPGTGGGQTGNGIVGTIITVFPRPIIPCYFCNITQYGVVRFLNASAGYNTFLIYINDQLVVPSLNNGESSQYGRVSAGIQTVTVAGENGYVYIQKQITVPMNGAITVAIINTDSGLDLLTITDTSCNGGTSGCIRACNLSNTNRNLNIVLNNGMVTFNNVRYKEVTNFRYLSPGYYSADIYDTMSQTGSPLVSVNFSVTSGVAYTMYVFNWNQSKDAIRTLVVEDRRN